VTGRQHPSLCRIEPADTNTENAHDHSTMEPE